MEEAISSEEDPLAQADQELDRLATTRRGFITGRCGVSGIYDQNIMRDENLRTIFLSGLMVASVMAGAAAFNRDRERKEIKFQDYDSFPLDSVKLSGMKGIDYEQTRVNVGETTSFRVPEEGWYQLHIRDEGEHLPGRFKIQQEKDEYEIKLSAL